MPHVLRTRPTGIVPTLLRTLTTRAAARRNKSLELDLEQRLSGFSREDQQKIRAYLALNPGDQAFIQALPKKS